jgi:uncharacterized repeat protein (TIGR01451 family)
MNSRYKLLNSGLIILSILILQKSLAQTFRFDQRAPQLSSFKFTTPVPTLDQLNKNQTNPFPYYTFFMEIGNGMYIKDDETHIHNEFSTQQDIISYNNLIPANSTALLNLVGHYDTIRPPKGQMVYTLSNTNGSPIPVQQKLGPSRYIGIDHSLGSTYPTVVKNDMVTTVITYRPDMPNDSGQPVAADCIVAFFYNKSDLGGAIFDILTPSKTYQMTLNDGSADIPRQVNAIRKHAEESGVYDNVTNIPLGGQSTDNILSALGMAKGMYGNALYFTIPANASIEEKNIFLSMLPVNSPSTGNLTSFKAYIIKYNSSRIINEQSQTTTLHFDEYARDPNGIVTSPACLDSFPRPFTDKPIRYDVDFQNDGEGIAQNVKVTVFIPEGIPFPSSDLLNITAMIKQQNLVFEKYTVATENSRNTYQFVTTRIHEHGTIFTRRNIIFRMPGIQLPGTLNQPANESLRHGRISFTLHTSKDKNQIPECMYSDISIVFYNTIQGMQKENPRIQDYTLTRRECSHVKHLPACSRLSIYPQPQN